MRTAKLALQLFALFSASLPPAAMAQGVFDGWRYTTEAVGARDADRVGWIDQHGAATELFVAQGPDYRPERVSASQANDGVPIEALSISADGRWLAWDRGGVGDAPGRGQLGDRGVWLLPPEGPPCRLAEGGRPALSPDGTRVAWISGGRLMTAPLRTDCEAMRAAAAEVATGGIVAPVWSPDGRALAFEAPIGRARRIGLWSVAGGVRWIDHQGQLDVAPSWSPDGTQLAFLRIDPSNDAIANQFDEDPPAPFTVMQAAVTELTPRPVWRSHGADGFARQWRSRITAPLMWLDDHRLALLSEHEGWQHVYALPVTGAPLTDLTPGRCEVDYADLMSEGRLVVSDNCTGMDRRRLVRIDSRTSAAVSLTPDDGVAVQPMAFDHGRRLIWRQARSQLQTVGILSGDRVLSPEPPPPDPVPAVREESVQLTATDGVVTNAQVFHPPGPGPHPALIFLHGGPQRQTFAAAAPSAFYSRFGWLDRALAARGYVVMQLNYRSGTGQGRDFRRIRGVARNGAGEDLDVLAARAWLAGRSSEVDATRIGLWGDSWGGWLTALALARHSDLFRAGVVISGVYDLSETSFGPGLDPAARALARSSSAAGWIDQWRSPVLIVHGARDNTVPYSQALEMEAALRRRGRDVDLLGFPREGHALQLEQDWEEMFDRAARFLDRTLRP